MAFCPLHRSCNAPGQSKREHQKTRTTAHDLPDLFGDGELYQQYQSVRVVSKVPVETVIAND
jgi:hypothetical protein